MRKLFWLALAIYLCIKIFAKDEPTDADYTMPDHSSEPAIMPKDTIHYLKPIYPKKKKVPQVEVREP